MGSTHDRDIRPRLKAHLAHPEAFLIDELGLDRGTVFVDVVVVDSDFHGFEIKAEADTLKRLDRQAEYYSRVLDFASLVATEKHLEKARTRLPEWWGLYDAETLAVVRAPTRNPGLTKKAIAKLLWKDEALALLGTRNASRGMSSKRIRYVWAKAVELFTLDELRAEVRSRLKARRVVASPPTG